MDGQCDQVLEWKCPKCPVKSNQIKILHKHIMQHHKDEEPRYFECHVCIFQTFIKSDLDEHVHQWHKIRKHEPLKEHCKEKIKEEIKMSELNTQDEEIKCDLCFFKTRNATGIKIHYKRMHGVTSNMKFNCDQCEAKLRTHQLLEMHKNKVHGTFICDRCDFKTNTGNVLKIHMTNQHIEDEFQSILKASYKRRASEMCHVSPEKERKLKKVTFQEEKQDVIHDKINTRKYQEMEQTLIAAMQTIETLENQNSELHAKIDNLGQLAIIVEDLKEEKSRLKTCEHCQHELVTEQGFREHKCNRNIRKNYHCVIEMEEISEFLEAPTVPSTDSLPDQDTVIN